MDVVIVSGMSSHVTLHTAFVRNISMGVQKVGGTGGGGRQFAPGRTARGEKDFLGEKIKDRIK